MADATWSGLMGGYRGKNFGNAATQGQLGEWGHGVGQPISEDGTAGGNLGGNLGQPGHGVSQPLGVSGGGWDAGGGAIGPMGDAGTSSDVTNVNRGTVAPALNAPGPVVPSSGGFATPRWAQSHQNAVDAVNNMSNSAAGDVGNITNAGQPPITEKGPGSPITYGPGGGIGGTGSPGGATGGTTPAVVGNGQTPKPTPFVPQAAPGPPPTGPGTGNLPPNDMGNGPATNPYATNFGASITAPGTLGKALPAGALPSGFNAPEGARGPGGNYAGQTFGAPAPASNAIPLNGRDPNTGKYPKRS